MGASRLARLGGAALLLVGGAIHLRLHLDDYGTVGIGRAFVVNAAASALVGAYVVLRRNRLGPVVGILVSAGSLAGLAAARTGSGVLGLRESGLVPSPEVPVTIAAEVGAIAALAAVLVLERRRSGHRDTPPTAPARQPRPLVAGDPR